MVLGLVLQKIPRNVTGIITALRVVKANSEEKIPLETIIRWMLSYTFKV